MTQLRRCSTYWMQSRESDPSFLLMPCSLILMTVLPSPSLTPFIAEWDDDMTYLYVDYPYYKKYLLFFSITTVTHNLFKSLFIQFMFLYNYNIFFHNKNLQFVTKATLGLLFIASNQLYIKYRKQVLRCNLFDEYVQMRADELVKEREHLLRGEDMKKWVWFSADLQETLMRCHR